MKQIKKQVLLVLCVVACLFSLTACGKTTDAGSGIDPMTEESLDSYIIRADGFYPGRSDDHHR